MKPPRTSDVLKSAAKKSAKQNILKPKWKQRAHRTEAGDTESALNTSAPFSPNLQRINNTNYSIVHHNLSLQASTLSRLTQLSRPKGRPGEISNPLLTRQREEKIVPDLMDSITTAITTAHTMASPVPEFSTRLNATPSNGFKNSLSLPKITIEILDGDPRKWHQWFKLFKPSIHKYNGLRDAQKLTYLQNFETHRARDSIIVYSYYWDYEDEAIADLTRKLCKPKHIVAA